jgi:hypothetical protein
VLCRKLASFVQSTGAFVVLMEWLKKRTDIQYLVLENVAGLGTCQEVRSWTSAPPNTTGDQDYASLRENQGSVHAVLFCTPTVCRPQAMLCKSLTFLCHVARPEWSFDYDRADQARGELQMCLHGVLGYSI